MWVIRNLLKADLSFMLIIARGIVYLHLNLRMMIESYYEITLWYMAVLATHRFLRPPDYDAKRQDGRPTNGDRTTGCNVVR